MEALRKTSKIAQSGQSVSQPKWANHRRCYLCCRNPFIASEMCMLRREQDGQGIPRQL